MATAHKSYRLDEELLSRLDAYAKAHGMRASEAVSHLLQKALEADDSGTTAAEDGHRTEAPTDGLEAVLDALKASNADLRAALLDSRATIATLTAQLAVKDQQISQAHELTSQAQRLQMADVARASITDGRRTTLRDRIKSLFGS